MDAQRLIDATQAGLQFDGSLLSSSEISLIEGKINTLLKILNTPDPRAIKVASDALNKATEEFAARRMNASVRSALAGKRISSFDA